TQKSPRLSTRGCHCPAWLCKTGTSSPLPVKTKESCPSYFGSDSLVWIAMVSSPWSDQPRPYGELPADELYSRISRGPKAARPEVSARGMRTTAVPERGLTEISWATARSSGFVAANERRGGFDMAFASIHER